ncbi:MULTISPECIES: hypothetical protein [unclassified Archaeoglobus]|jgi:hypothetical protein|uniref:hypothetical protein n=1 Tax=unclassified Archaeoglobus TaxID=2643606 RepID=UPI0025BEC0CB|nr:MULTISPECIES: hypothetical protein [unclassified Archaeoglobus]
MSTKINERFDKESVKILAKFITRKYGNKKNFLDVVREKLGIRLSSRAGYETIFSRICDKSSSEKLLSILGVKSVTEADIRILLSDALYYGLPETSWQSSFSPLYEELMGKKIKIKRKVDKKLPAFEIAFHVSENEYISAWTKLYKKGVLPPFIHYKNITIGPLGWLKSFHSREGGVWELYSTVIEIVEKKFDPFSQEIIVRTWLGTLQQASLNPSKYGIPVDESEKIRELFRKVEIEKDDSIRYAKILQLIHTYFNDAELCFIVNELLAGNVKGPDGKRIKISPPRVRGLYERFPYSFSEWIITPHGIFQQISRVERDPSQELANLIKKAIKRGWFDERSLEPELKEYKGEFDQKLLEYCIKENPENILRNLFGTPQLRKIAEDLQIRAASLIDDKDEIVKIILLQLGFNLPPVITGLEEYRKFLNECRKKLGRESPSAIVTDLYRETEGVLRNLSYFYLCFLYNTTLNNIDQVIREKVRLREKPFEKWGLGHFINLLRRLNKIVKKDRTLLNKLRKEFGRSQLIPQRLLNELDEISPKLSSSGIRHKKDTTISREDINEVINKLIDISHKLETQEIWPRVIKLIHKIENGYGIEYFEAVDEKGERWIIRKRWLDTSRPYFMHSKTYPVAINPILIEKVF